MNVAPRIFKLRSSVLRQMLFFKNCSRKFHYMGGIPGENIPFRFDNRFFLTLKFAIFFGSGMTAPFLVTAYQLNKDKIRDRLSGKEKSPDASKTEEEPQEENENDNENKNEDAKAST